MKTPTVLAVLALVAGAAGADTVTQDLAFDWNAETGLEIGSFDAFDDAGGTRILTGVNVSIDGQAQWDLTLLNYSAQAFGPDDWHAEGFANFNVHLGEFGSGVERIVGYIEFEGLTGELGAGSGDPIFGDPGDPAVSASYTTDLLAAFSLDPSEFGVVTSGPVLARILGFTDVVIGGPDGAPGIIVGETDLLGATGVLTLSYEFTTVPAPSALALLTGAGILGARRRR